MTIDETSFAAAKTWLNKLLELLHDSHDGYEECAINIKNDFLKKLFLELAQVRNAMIAELENHAKSLNILPEKTGSMLAAGHRLWIDLKTLIGSGDNEAIIAEIKRGETHTLENYQQALAQALPVSLTELLRKQHDQIANNLSQIVWHSDTEAKV